MVVREVLGLLLLAGAGEQQGNQQDQFPNQQFFFLSKFDA